MDTFRINALLRAIELKSLAKAASEYYYSASAFSHMADSIEKELGAKILERKYNGIELTEIGKKIVEKLKKIVLIEYEIHNEINISNDSNLLRIGTYSSISKFILPKLLKGFRDIYPDINVNIIVGDNFRNWLSDNKVDIIFSENLHEDNCIWEKVYEDKYMAVLPKNYNQFGKNIFKEELYNNTIILPSDYKTIQYLNKDNFKKKIEISSDDDFIIIEMVKAGLGVSVLPELTLKKKDKGIKVENIVPKITRELGFTYFRANTKIKNISYFSQYTKENIKNK